MIDFYDDLDFILDSLPDEDKEVNVYGDGGNNYINMPSLSELKSSNYNSSPFVGSPWLPYVLPELLVLGRGRSRADIARQKALEKSREMKEPNTNFMGAQDINWMQRVCNTMTPWIAPFFNIPGLEIRSGMTMNKSTFQNTL